MVNLHVSNFNLAHIVLTRSFLPDICICYSCKPMSKGKGPTRLDGPVQLESYASGDETECGATRINRAGGQVDRLKHNGIAKHLSTENTCPNLINFESPDVLRYSCSRCFFSNSSGFLFFSGAGELRSRGGVGWGWEQEEEGGCRVQRDGYGRWWNERPARRRSRSHGDGEWRWAGIGGGGISPPVA